MKNLETPGKTGRVGRYVNVEIPVNKYQKKIVRMSKLVETTFIMLKSEVVR